MTDSIQDIHDGDRDAIIEAISEQAVELDDQEQVRVACPCGITGPLRRMFTCYFCEVTLCPECAEEHFEGERFEEMRSAIDTALDYISEARKANAKRQVGRANSRLARAEGVLKPHRPPQPRGPIYGSPPEDE